MPDNTAVYLDRTVVGLVGACDDLDERGLARAVFPDKRMDFAGP